MPRVVSKKESQLFFAKAKELQDDGFFKESIPYLKDFLKANPENPSAYFRLGIAHRRINDLETALEMFSKASALSPESIRYRNFMFMVLSSMGKDSEACETAYGTCELIGWTDPKEKKYNIFKECVFPERASIIKEWVEPYVGKAACFGEIGCFEGLSSCWWLDKILTHSDSKLICFDPMFQDNYWKNITASGSEQKVTANEVFSQVGIPTLDDNSLDVVYIDGLHIAWAVLFDFMMSLSKIKTDGLFIFDDYDKPDQSGVGQTVKQAVDFIADISSPDIIKVERSTSPIIFRKTNSEIPERFTKKILSFFEKVYKIDVSKIKNDLTFEEQMKHCYNEVMKDELIPWPANVLKSIASD